MKDSKLFIILSVYILNAGTTFVEGTAEGYYWRDYNGRIPKDAIKGSLLNNGQTLYIGQVLHPGLSITPGYIKGNNPNVFYEYGNAELTATEGAKILCTQHLEQFSWREVKQHDPITVLGDGSLVVAGHDTKRPLTVGKATTERGEIVGKVLMLENEFGPMYYGENNKSYLRTQFHVLIYNPNGTVEAHKSDEDCKASVINLFFYN